MNYCRRSDAQRKMAWDYLRKELEADLVLAQEALPPATVERVFRPVHDSDPQWRWGSAVVALHPGVRLRPRKRVPLNGSSHMEALAADELPDSHPGSCAVADVVETDGTVRLTAVSLYGQWEMRPGGKDMDASPRLHRMLFDLTSVFASRAVPVVVAGDWNISTQGANSADNEAAAVFARLRAWRMADCITHTRHTRPRLTNCHCSEGDACSHVQTYRHNNRTNGDSAHFDYAFVSESLLPKLECVVVDDAAAWALSDHCPILIDVSPPAGRSARPCLAQ
jgi:endonuclease/exonuclease/phosphatase family metal-dependent hydrolase